MNSFTSHTPLADLQTYTLAHLPLANLHLAHFRLHFKAHTGLRLSAYPGSALRGGFGHAFRKVVCTMGPIPCDTCMLRTACPYYQLFEAPVPAHAPTILQKTGRVPHAFIIEPETSDRRFLQPGDTFSAGLTLLGPAIRSLPYFLMAFQLFGRIGLGRHSQTRGQFVLAAADALMLSSNGTVRQTFVPYFDGATGLAPGFPPSFQLAELAAIQTPNDNGENWRIEIHVQTPMRLKSRGDLVTNLTPREFFYHLCQRLSNLFFLYGEPAGQTWNFIPLLDEAEKLQLHGNLHWWDWRRYSSRQKTEMNFGGLVGRFQLSGPKEILGKFLPLLKFGEWLHVGKGTTFGLGKYQLTVK